MNSEKCYNLNKMLNASTIVYISFVGFIEKRNEIKCCPYARADVSAVLGSVAI